MSPAATTEICPGPAELAGLVAGRLAAARHDVLEAHVSACTQCLARLEGIEELPGVLVEDLFDVDAAQSATEPQFHEAVARIKSGSAEAAAVEGVFHDPLIDTRLGDFHIIRQIGRGGMGIVYEAEQLSLSRRVALKVLPNAALVDARTLIRFENEARAAASLKHPNIVDVYAVGIERGVSYYAMRLIEGPNLGQAIAGLRGDEPAGTAAALFPDRTSFGYFAEIARLGVQAADALQLAHDHGIVHRDVKPSNLLIDERRQLYVADFGVAQMGSTRSFTLTGDVVGTMRYLSPEQASAQRGSIDHRTDIYGLGVTLYELATLHPFYNGSAAEILLKIVSAVPPAPRAVNPRIPVDLETIILKATAANPADRYATAADLAADLKRFREHRPILARRPTLWCRASKWCRRKRHAVARAAIAAAVVTGSAALLLAWHQSQQELITIRKGHIETAVKDPQVRIDRRTFSTIPATEIATARSPSSAFSIATMSLAEVGDETVLKIDLDQQRLPSERSQACFSMKVEFSVHDVVPYELSGAHRMVGRNQFELTLHLLDVTAVEPVTVLHNNQLSYDTPNESFVLGEPGGDTTQIFEGELQGELEPGHSYQLYATLGTTAQNVSEDYIMDDGATSQGHLKLVFGTPHPRMSESMLAGAGALLLGLGGCAAMGYRYRREVLRALRRRGGLAAGS